MWLPGVLVTYLIFVKPSTAELGLPILFLGPKDKIHSLIDNARADRESFNKTLQDLDAIPFPLNGPNFGPVRRNWQNAIVKLSWIQNYTLTNLTKAIDDQTSGFRKVMDGLYGNIKYSKQQLVVNRGLINIVDEWEGGTSNSQLLKGTRTDLEDCLDDLWDALEVLDEVISEALRETPITESTIDKDVISDMTLTVWSTVVKILGSIKPLKTLINGLLVGANFARQDDNQTRSELYKMIDWKHPDSVVNASGVTSTKIQITTTTLMKNLNQTVWTAYNPLVKSKLFQGANTIGSFLTNFSRNILTLDTFVTSNAQTVFQRIVNSVSKFQEIVEQNIYWPTDYLGVQVFANATTRSLAENCLQKHPLVNATLGRVFKLFERCMLNQLQYISNIMTTVEEFLQPIRAAAMAPLVDLQTCTASKLNRTLCMGKFATALKFESSGTTSNRTLMASINRMTKQTQKVMDKEFSEVELRFVHCANVNLASPIMKELLKERNKCLGVEY